MVISESLEAFTAGLTTLPVAISLFFMEMDKQETHNHEKQQIHIKILDGNKFNYFASLVEFQLFIKKYIFLVILISTTICLDNLLEQMFRHFQRPFWKEFGHIFHGKSILWHLVQ